MTTTSLVDYRFAKSHEWLYVQQEAVKVGITDYAQREMKDMVFVELPEVGKKVRKGDAFAVLESVKAVNDMYAPVSGKVISSNKAVADNPALVNEDPYGKGWIAQIQISSKDELSGLLNFVEYKADVLEEVVHILYLDEGNKIHYLPAVRGDDGQIVVGKRELSSVVTTSIVSLAQKRKYEAAEEFEYLINKSKLDERELQRFLEKHPAFLLGTEYEQLFPQVVLKHEDEDDLKPDFILRPIAGVSYEPKIIELKLPTQPVIKPKPRREGLYANVYEGIMQLRTYAGYFQETENREYVRKTLGFTAYRPRLALIVGKSIELGDEKLRAEIIQSFPNVELMTYHWCHPISEDLREQRVIGEARTAVVRL